MRTSLRSLFRVLTGRRVFEANMSDELSFHIERYTEDLVRSGISPQEAARRARLEFGGVQKVQEECREARGLHGFDELVRQLRYAARLLRKTPGFTFTALATIAVCLGANLTIFAVVDAVLVRPLSFPEPGRLVTIYNTYPKAGVERDGSSITNYYERRGQIPALASVALYNPTNSIVGEPASAERVPVMRVSPDFFATLGTGLAQGRGFTDQETTYDTDRVVILTDAFRRQHYAPGAPVLGTQLRINDVLKTVIGILPPGFRFLSSEARLYVPLSSRLEDRGPGMRHAGGNSRHIVARLQPGATLEQAQAQIDARNTALAAGTPEATMIAESGFRSAVTSLHGDHVASVASLLLWMQAGALALLLIGMVNLANLLLIRSSGRVKETAVRQAMGASHKHILSEILVETTVLTFAGGLLGLALGAAGIRLLAVLGADRLPLGALIVFDARLALAGFAPAALLGVALAVPIAWFHFRSELAEAIHSETRGGVSSLAAQRLRHGFIVAQIALALVLLAGAGMLGLSLERAMAVSPGFRPDHVLTAQVSLPWKRYPNWEARVAFNERLLRDLARQPGVITAGLANNVPLSGNSGKSAATIQGRERKPGESPRGHYSYGVDGDYFSAMGFTLREGRFLNAADSKRAERVCVVDEDFAHYYWPQGGAVGQRLFQGADAGKDADAFTIAGVVSAAKQSELTDESAQGAIYYPYARWGDERLYVAVRTSLPPASIGLALQKVVREVDPSLLVSDVRTMDTRVADSLLVRRSPVLVAGFFSMIALLLTTIGTYGVLSYAVAHRRREIGLRMALGARPSQIRSQFLGIAMRLLAAGTILGLAGAWLTGEAMRSLLFQVPTLHAATLAGATGVIAAATLAACLWPAHRAARVSPTEALAE